MFESRFDLNSPIANTKLAVSKIIGPDQWQQQMRASVYKNKVTRNFGVNTSRIITTENSFDMIKPITHSVFPSIARKSNKRLTAGDGLDQQFCVPVKKIRGSNCYSSQPKQKKVQQYRYNNNFNQNIQKMKELKNNLNPQICNSQKPEESTNKIRKIVNMNLKNIENSSNQIRKSRTIYYKKRFQKQKQLDEQEPIVKKNFKFSNASTKITEPNNIKRLTINTEADHLKKSTQQITDFVAPLKQSIKIEETHQINIQKRQRPKLIDIDYPEQMKQNQLTKPKLQNNSKNQKEYSFKQINNRAEIIIDLQTSVSTLKRILIQCQNELKVEFKMPQTLFNPPNQNSSNEQLKSRMWEIFKYAGHQPLIITIKRYQDRVQLRCKNFCAIWYYNGKTYIGGWTGQKTLAELNKHGVGVEWSGKSEPFPYIYYGQFKDNKKEGYGLLKKQNNEIYIGCWKNNKRQGWGRIYGSDYKLKVNGQFVENELFCSEEKI